MYEELVVWPGDGPKVGFQAITEAHSRMLAKLLGQDPEEILEPRNNEAIDNPNWKAEDKKNQDHEDEEDEKEYGNEESKEDPLPGEANDQNISSKDYLHSLCPYVLLPLGGGL